jgi:hypothetical protein
MKLSPFIATLLIALASVTAHAADATSVLAENDRRAIFSRLLIRERDAALLDYCGNPMAPNVSLIDLNGDGKPEVFVKAAYLACHRPDTDISLHIKTAKNEWMLAFRFEAKSFRILKTAHNGYLDIEVVSDEPCRPIWHWDGSNYAYSKNCE